MLKTAHPSSFSAHSCIQQHNIHACAETQKHMLTHPVNIEPLGYVLIDRTPPHITGLKAQQQGLACIAKIKLINEHLFGMKIPKIYELFG